MPHALGGTSGAPQPHHRPGLGGPGHQRKQPGCIHSFSAEQSGSGRAAPASAYGARARIQYPGRIELKRLTIQARLALWFFLSVAMIVAIFVTGSWLAMRASMYHSIDRDLRYRVGMVVPFIQLETLNTRE